MTDLPPGFELDPNCDCEYCAAWRKAAEAKAKRAEHEFPDWYVDGCKCRECEYERQKRDKEANRAKPFDHIGPTVLAYRARHDSCSLRLDRKEDGSASFVFMHGSPCAVYEVPYFDIPTIIERLQEIVAENEK